MEGLRRLSFLNWNYTNMKPTTSLSISHTQTTKPVRSVNSHQQSLRTDRHDSCNCFVISTAEFVNVIIILFLIYQNWILIGLGRIVHATRTLHNITHCRRYLTIADCFLWANNYTSDARVIVPAGIAGGSGISIALSILDLHGQSLNPQLNLLGRKKEKHKQTNTKQVQLLITRASSLRALWMSTPES